MKKNKVKIILIMLIFIIAIAVKGLTGQFEEDIKQLMPEYMRVNAVIKVGDDDSVIITGSIPFEKADAIMELGNALNENYLGSLEIFQDVERIDNYSIIRFKMTGFLGKTSTFVNDKGEKIVKEYNKDRQLVIERTLVDDRLEGMTKDYYKSGKLKSEIPFKNNKIEGVCREYYETGRLKQVVSYKENIQEGIKKIYYESGQLKEEVPYLNGKIDGVKKEYYENGKLSLESAYKNGNREGITKYYNENGKLDWEEMYKDGECIERNYSKGYSIFVLLSLCLMLLWKIVSSPVGIVIFAIILLVFISIYLIRKRKLQSRKGNAQ